MNACVECVDLVCEKPPDLEFGGGIFALNPFDFIIDCPFGFFCFGGQHVVVLPPPVFPPPNTGNPIILRLQGCLSEIVRILPATATPEQIAAAANSMQIEWAGQQAICFGIGNPPPPGVPPPQPPLPPPRVIPPLVIDISGSPTPACVGFGYSTILHAFGTPGTAAPLTWQIVSGSLPPGLVTAVSFDTKDFFITGTPITSGNFVILVRVTDALGNFNQRAFTIQVLQLIGTPPDAQVGSPYSFQFTANGGNAPYTFTLSAGVLPDGLTLDSSGLLSGTPTTSQSVNFQVCVTGS